MHSRDLGGMQLRSPFRLPSGRQIVEPWRANVCATNQRVLETNSLPEGGFKSRVFCNKHGDGRTQCVDILTSRFAFETHAPEEFRKGFAHRMPESASKGHNRCENHLQTVLCEKDFKEFLETKDREVLEKEIDDAVRTKKKHLSFRSAFAPLGEKVLKQQTERKYYPCQCGENQRSLLPTRPR